MTQPTEELIVWANTDVNLPKLAGPNKTKPIDDLINKGWDFTEKPTADEFNYILNNMGQWINWTVTDIEAGTSLNTPNTLVRRDGGGNFSAGTITANLNGNASTASTLQTSRTINGTSFNGSSNITTNSWGTSRTFALIGAITGSASIDGSANISVVTTDTVSVTNIRLGTAVTFQISNATGTPQYAPGYVLVGATNDGNADVDMLFTRPLQQYINGIWYTIGNI